jgi:hypothetical protein
MREFIWRLVAWVVARPRIVARLEGRAVWPSIRLRRIASTGDGLLFSGSQDTRLIILRGALLEYQMGGHWLEIRRPGHTARIPAGEKIQASALSLEGVLVLLVSWGRQV